MTLAFLGGLGDALQFIKAGIMEIPDVLVVTKADLGKIAREIVECAGVGVCTSDYGQLTFRKVRRPVFPLDPDMQ